MVSQNNSQRSASHLMADFTTNASLSNFNRNNSFVDLKRLEMLKYFGVCFGTIMAAFTLVLLVINTLILYVYVKSNTLRRVQDILLAILSTVSIYIAFTLPFYMSYWVVPEVLMVSKIPCLLFGNLTHSGVMTSSFVLLFLGLERYFFIVHPFWVLEISIKRLCGVMMLVFLVFFLLAMIPIFGYNDWESTHFCERDVFPREIYALQRKLALLSVLVTSFCHLWVLKVALKHSRQIASLEKMTAHCYITGNGQPSHTLFPKRERDIMKTVGRILIGYLVCYLPHYTTSFFSNTPEIIKQILFCVLISNSLVSPIIYAKSSGRFVNQARALLLRSSRD